MIDPRFRQWAAEKLGLRQRLYKQISPDIIADLAVFCGVWDDNVSVADVSDARLRELHGRRQVFFRIWKHVNLSPTAFETAYKDELERRAGIASRATRTGE